MITKDRLAALSLHWSLVIQVIYPDLEVIVRGDDTSITSLLSQWETGNAAFSKPTESELLAALTMVEARIQEAEAQRIVIRALVQPTEGLGMMTILSSMDDAHRLLIALLDVAGAISPEGTIRPGEQWLPGWLDE